MVAGQAPLRAQLNQKELTVKRKPSRVNNTLLAGGIQTQERQEGGAVAANRHPGQVGYSFCPSEEVRMKTSLKGCVFSTAETN